MKIKTLKNEFTYKQENSGDWILKSIKAVDKKGVLKPKYKDLPKVKSIYRLEGDVLERFNKVLIQSSSDFLKQLK